MGIAVSGWNLAKTVSKCGQLGVVSGTGIDAVLARRLQLGDPDGGLRRALDNFPWPEMACRVRDTYFVPGGKAPEAPFKLNPMKRLRLSQKSVELLIVANFVEVFLAKEGHDGVIGVNFLEKIQRPTLPSLFGAMLAGVDYVLMGAGIPLAIPGILDSLAIGEKVELKLGAVSNPDRHAYAQSFDPRAYAESEIPSLTRPKFLAIISSDTLAQTFIRRGSGYTDGFVVEHHTAGGHNAPPRKDRSAPDRVNEYGPRDEPNLEAIAKLGRPFWLAGGYASPEQLQWALDQGATGVQLGSIFATSNESGLLPHIRQELIDRYLDKHLKIRTDFRASPTGFPFKVVQMEGTMGQPHVYEKRDRICDMGYLREMYSVDEKRVGFRCPSEPVDDFVKKGGTEERASGRQCLCNGLMATIGLGQVRDGVPEPPVVTAGDDFSFLEHILSDGARSYGAKDVLNYLLSSVTAAQPS
jgi:nitronate monooxygenase